MTGNTIEGVRLPSLPTHHPRVQRKLPAPFQRPSIAISAPGTVKRAWRTVLVTDLAAGDTIPEVGVLDTVDQHVAVDGTAVRWSVTVTSTAGITRTYPGETQVLAFVPRPGTVSYAEPVNPG